MIKKFIKGKVYVFIDAANTFYAQRTFGWKISYEKLMKYFKKECGKDVKCFIYAAYDENKQNEQKFLDMLDINGYILRTKAIKKIKISSYRDKLKGNLDMELAFEMVDLADKYDTAILMSGDSDFSVPIDRIKKKSKWIIVMSTRGRISKELLERAKYIDLHKLKNEISQ
ncbi:MAG: NYN domain-containing protein [Patescibacteria group bacterium]